MAATKFIQIAEDLDLAGLLWRPEIGDEVADRGNLSSISILVDPKGMSPTELRSAFIWLPTVEQMIIQLEARQAVLSHAGLELSENSMAYRIILQTTAGRIESMGESIRTSIGLALRNLLLADMPLAVN